MSRQEAVRGRREQAARQGNVGWQQQMYVYTDVCCMCVRRCLKKRVEESLCVCCEAWPLFLLRRRVFWLLMVPLFVLLVYYRANWIRWVFCHFVFSFSSKIDQGWAL